MTESHQVCTSCGAVDSLDLELASGTLACTRCGTVSNDSSTASFEFLARVDEEDAFTGGRTQVNEKGEAWGGGIGASGMRALGGKASQWAAGVGERRAMFHAKKKSESDKLIRRLLTRFDAASRYRYTTNLFANMKQKLGFFWGYRAEVYAAACVYVALRQDDREIWISDLMDSCESIKEPVHISRAIRLIKVENKIRTKDVDPVLFVERVLVHLQKVLREPKPTFHFGKTTKPFYKKNLDWVRGLSLEEARTLAVSLLGFSREIYLVKGRAPEQVACAVVLVALEGIARRPSPVAEQFVEEMAWVTNTSAFTIQERHREYTAALTAYAPKLPWVASKASKWRKHEVVEHTKDIVQFRKVLDAKEKRERKKKEVAEQKARAEAAGKGNLDEDGFDDAAFDAQAGAGSEYWDDDDVDDGAKREDPASISPEVAFADPLKTQTDVYGFAPASEQNLDAARPKQINPNEEVAGKRPGIYVRGSTEWTRHRAAQGALARGLGHSPSPAPPTSLNLPEGSPGLDTPSPTSIADRPDYATLATYGQKPEAIRAQLAPTNAGKTLNKLGTRLSSLLWEKPAEDIDDDDLFEDGELDSYIRTEEEANLYRQLPRYTQMVKASLEQELKPKQPVRPRRFRRGQPNPEYIKLQEEAAAKGVGINTILRARMKRDRGEEEDEEEDVQKEFRPRKKKTKVDAEAKARLAALLAQGSEDEDESGAHEGTDEWVGVAMNVAGQLDPGLVDVEGVDDEDEDEEPEAPTEGEDWRREFRYGTVNSDGYEDE